MTSLRADAQRKARSRNICSEFAAVMSATLASYSQRIFFTIDMQLQKPSEMRHPTELCTVHTPASLILFPGEV